MMKIPPILLCLALIPTLSFAQFEKDIDSLINIMEFDVAFFDLKTDQKLESLTNIEADTLRIKYILTIPNMIGMEYYEIKDHKSTSSYELMDYQDLVIDPKGKENENRTVYLFDGLFVPKKKGKIKITPRTLLLKFLKPTNKKDFFGSRLYEKEPTEKTIKSKAIALNFL